jgi:hypothetical protein
MIHRTQASWPQYEIAAPSRRGLVLCLQTLTAVLLAIAVCQLAAGCASRQKLHPRLLLEDEQIDRSVRRGKTLVSTWNDPLNAFTRGVSEANVRVSADVIVRGAQICWPEEEIAYQIAVGGDKSDKAVHIAVEEALKRVERQIRFFATLQLPKTKDPSTLEFFLRTSARKEYPALIVEEPVFERSVVSPYDASAPVSGIYYFTVHFPVRGGPGIPPIGPTVRYLDLVVRDGSSEGSVRFELPTR